MANKIESLENTSRPNLTSELDETEFHRWYWLKSELLAFCREESIPAFGSKNDLSVRVAAFLGKRPMPTSDGVSNRRLDASPEILTIDTVVTSGYRLSRKLRAFFDEHESAFHFNQALRDFFKAPAGRTLGDALAIYRNSKSVKAESIISAQFEYNNHMREFFKMNKGVSINEARMAWWQKRLNRKRD